MRKSTLIAKCLVTGGHVSEISDGELITESYINQEFPQLDFNEWNIRLTPIQSERFLEKVNFSSPIQLEKLVQELHMY